MAVGTKVKTYLSTFLILSARSLIHDFTTLIFPEFEFRSSNRDGFVLSLGGADCTVELDIYA